MDRYVGTYMTNDFRELKDFLREVTPEDLIEVKYLEDDYYLVLTKEGEKQKWKDWIVD